MTKTPVAERITAPRIHLNGTSKGAIMEGYLRALDALRKAQDSLAATAPNMRDFYVQKDGDRLFREAARQHAARYAAIRDVIEEFEALGEAVVDQQK